VDLFAFIFFPCCRWAQPAVAGALAPREAHGIQAEQIDRIRVEAFSVCVK
jgi:2-methylcitrate dehydratase PrpD